MRRLRLVDLPPLRNAARARGRAGYWLSLIAALLLCSCSSQTPKAPATGVAYVGPATLKIRKELGSKAQVVATVNHGDKLDVIDTRRRFMQVRTAEGIEGWTDSRVLLAPQQMDDLRDLASAAAKLPSEGAASTYDVLNMHIDPNRQSPSFFQLPESAVVDVIGHRVAPRYAPRDPEPARPRHRTATRSKKSSKKRAGPEPPHPPAPPANWEALSRPHVSDLPGYVPPQPKPVPLDDWSLVRTKDGKAGWVLSRMLMMSIPDEVAQYAEGHHITSYLSLGDVPDQESGQMKHNWLWTTAVSTNLPYEFDRFRVFVWSLKRHRYETAYIERNVKGYYPVLTESLPDSDEKGFSLVIEDKDGKLYKRTYGFSGYRVHLVSKELYRPPAPLPEVSSTRDFEPVAPAAPPQTTWRQKIAAWRKRWTDR